MAAWTNATASRAGAVAGPTTRGVLRPAVTERTARLRRDMPVSAPLEPFVERYWAVRWDRTAQAPFRSEILSHPSVNVSLEAGTEPRFGHAMPAVLLHGVVGRRFVVDLAGRGRVVAVKFRPGGFTALTGVPVPRADVRAVTGARWLDEGRPGATRRLLEALGAGTEAGGRGDSRGEDGQGEDGQGGDGQDGDGQDDAAVAARLDAALLPGAHAPDTGYEDLRVVVARMLADRSLVRVEQVADLAGVGVRTLQRLFAGYVGMSPKAVLALYRMQDAVAAIDAEAVDGDADGDGVPLAALAAELGWFDHAHFCRDFRRFVGTSPGEYVARARADRSAGWAR